MKNIIYILINIHISILFAKNNIANEILLNAIQRLDNINYSFKLSSKSDGNDKKIQNYQVSIFWPQDDSIVQKINVKSLDSEKKKPPSFWEHRYRDNNKIKRWMTLPITGKLKDISNKKFSKKEFSFSDFNISINQIKSNINKILGEKEFNGKIVTIIESKKINAKGNVKEIKNIWISKDKLDIVKIESFTKSGRLFRELECKDFQIIEGIIFPKTIIVNDKKSKLISTITLDSLVINPEYIDGLFIPLDQ